MPKRLINTYARLWTRSHAGDPLEFRGDVGVRSLSKGRRKNSITLALPLPNEKLKWFEGQRFSAIQVRYGECGKPADVVHSEILAEFTDCEWAKTEMLDPVIFNPNRTDAIEALITYECVEAWICVT